ncbi:hypothetical protein BDW69DRAFT_149330 [Aspergillus filifer]
MSWVALARLLLPCLLLPTIHLASFVQLPCSIAPLYPGSLKASSNYHGYLPEAEAPNSHIRIVLINTKILVLLPTPHSVSWMAQLSPMGFSHWCQIMRYYQQTPNSPGQRHWGGMEGCAHGESK